MEIIAGIDWNDAYSNVDIWNSALITLRVAEPYAMIAPKFIDPHIKTRP